jgi:hypothetical protein
VSADGDDQLAQAEPERHQAQQPYPAFGYDGQAQRGEQRDGHKSGDPGVLADPDLPRPRTAVRPGRRVEHRQHDHVVDAGAGEQSNGGRDRGEDQLHSAPERIAHSAPASSAVVLGGGVTPIASGLGRT